MSTAAEKPLLSARHLRGLSLSALAERMGLPADQKGNVHRIENGNPSLATVQRYLDGLGCQLVVVPQELAPEVEAFIENNGVVGATDKTSLLDEVLGED